MTVSDAPGYTSYISDGVQVAYAVAFDYQDQNAWVLVVRQPVGTTDEDSQVTLAEGPDYTLANGTVTLNAPLTAGDVLFISRIPPYSQLRSLPAQGRFAMPEIEDALDQLTMLVQEQEGGRAALEEEVNGLTSSLASAITSLTTGFQAGDAAVTTAFQQADAALSTAFTAELVAVRAEFDVSPGSTVDTRTVLATGGTTSRALKDHLADELGLPDFGASTGAIASVNDAAVTAALAALSYVYVPEGVFLLSAVPSDLSRFWGPGQFSVSGVVFNVPASVLPVSPENLFRNTEWALATAIGIGQKYLADGTGTKPDLSISSYSTGVNEITCYCANTYDLKTDDLLQFHAPADTNLVQGPVRVYSVVANVSFKVRISMGGVASASAACTATPMMRGGVGSASVGDALDHWTKATAAWAWREDHPVNTLPGAKYSAGYLRSTTAAEYFDHPIPAEDLYLYQGRRIVFGIWAMRKFGTGRWRLLLNTNGTGGGAVFSNYVTTTDAADGVWAYRELSIL
ncbi:MAG TPA: hypothetical protein VMK12_31950, partial [Anaeromyxobacteraceae bacterium]|nr:hypothetical protein [Anaeromyxobacteraceae bacterium]